MNKKIKIERGVPVPVQTIRATWPLDDMDVGDSFTVPPDRDANNLRSAISRYHAKTDKMFTVRLIRDGQYRCWRLK